MVYTPWLMKTIRILLARAVMYDSNARCLVYELIIQRITGNTTIGILKLASRTRGHCSSTWGVVVDSRRATMRCVLFKWLI